MPGEDRRQRLYEALAAYDEALRFYRPDTAPLAYAMTQNNRATILSELATLAWGGPAGAAVCGTASSLGSVSIFFFVVNTNSTLRSVPGRCRRSVLLVAKISCVMGGAGGRSCANLAPGQSGSCGHAAASCTGRLSSAAASCRLRTSRRSSTGGRPPQQVTRCSPWIGTPLTMTVCRMISTIRLSRTCPLCTTDSVTCWMRTTTNPRLLPPLRGQWRYNPNFAMAHRNLAGTLIELGELVRAAEALAIARQLEPDAERLTELEAQLAAARAESSPSPM